MKLWPIALLSLLALVLALVLGYFLPNGVVALTDHQLSGQVLTHKIYGLELDEVSMVASGAVPLSQKLELVHSSQFALATLSQGQQVNMDQAYEITCDILCGLLDTEPYLEMMVLQPCVAFFSDNQSFVVWLAYVQFQDFCVMQLLLDDATGAVLALDLTSRIMPFDELMPGLFNKSPEDTAQETTPAERLAQRMISILTGQNGITAGTYNQKTDTVSFVIGQEQITTSLLISTSESRITFNSPLTQGPDVIRGQPEQFIYP